MINNYNPGLNQQINSDFSLRKIMGVFNCMFGFMQKQNPENLAFFILRIIELFTREV